MSYLTEFPWNQATLDISDYSKWKENDIETSSHWQRIQDNLLLSLIKKMLHHGPSKRYNLNQIKNHLWFKKKFKDSGMVTQFPLTFLYFCFYLISFFWFGLFYFCTIRVSKSQILPPYVFYYILLIRRKKNSEFLPSQVLL